MWKKIIPYGKNPDELRVEELIQVVQSEITARNRRARYQIAGSMILFFWGGTIISNYEGMGWIPLLGSLYLGFTIPINWSRPSTLLSGALGEISEGSGPDAIHYLISQINCSPPEARHAVKSALSRLLPIMLAQKTFQFSIAAEDQLCIYLNEKDALEHPNLLSFIIQNLSNERAPRHLAFISSLFLKERDVPIANSLKNAAYIIYTKHTSQIVTTINSYEKLAKILGDLAMSQTWDDYIWAREEFIKCYDKILLELYSYIDPVIKLELYRKIGSRYFTDRKNGSYNLNVLGDTLDGCVLRLLSRLEDIDALPELKRHAKTEVLQGTLQIALHNTIIKLETAKAKALNVKNLLHTTDSVPPYGSSSDYAAEPDASIFLT